MQIPNTRKHQLPFVTSAVTRQWPEQTGANVLKRSWETKQRKLHKKSGGWAKLNGWVLCLPASQWAAHDVCYFVLHKEPWSKAFPTQQINHFHSSFGILWLILKFMCWPIKSEITNITNKQQSHWCDSLTERQLWHTCILPCFGPTSSFQPHTLWKMDNESLLHQPVIRHV